MSTTTGALGRLIRTRRESMNLSLRGLAEQCGITNTTVMRIESGEIIKPREELLRALAMALNLSASDLLAVAGYGLPSELPSFRPYLRSKYRHLPPDALAELEQTFADIAERYGSAGPAPGEDERE